MSVVWSLLGFMLLVHIPIDYGQLAPTGYQTFVNHPYCLLDPTCVNVLAPSTVTLDGGGFANNDFRSMNTVGGLAIANFGLFVGSAAALSVLFQRLVASPRLRSGLIVAVCIWMWLEINRWFAYIPDDDELRWAAQHVATDVLSFALLSIALWRGGKDLPRAETRQRSQTTRGARG